MTRSPDSKKAGRTDKWMACTGFEMLSTVPVDANSGAAKGARQHHPLMVTKEWGPSSPQILQAHWTNEVLTEVIIEVVGRSADGKKEVVQERTTLSDAVIVSVKRYSAQDAKTTSEHDVDHLETVGLRFRKITVENPEAGTATTDDWNTPGS